MLPSFAYQRSGKWTECGHVLTLTTFFFFNLVSVYLVFKVRMKVCNSFCFNNLTYFRAKYHFEYRFSQFCALWIDWIIDTRHYISDFFYFLFLRFFFWKKPPNNNSITSCQIFFLFMKYSHIWFMLKGYFLKNENLMLFQTCIFTKQWSLTHLPRYCTDLYLCCCESSRIWRIHSRGERGLLSLLH